MAFQIKMKSGQIYDLDKPLIRLGRAQDNNIVLSDQTISRYHLNLYQNEGQIILENAGSSIGFKVNGKSAGNNTTAQPGDEVQIGNLSFVIGVDGSFKKTATNSATNSPHRASGLNPVRLLIVAIVLIVLGVAFMEEEKPVSKQVSQNPPKLKPLKLPDHLGENMDTRGATEITAAGRFKEAMRDYFNQNYVRAINGFQDALTLDPSHSKARYYLNNAELRLESLIKRTLKDAELSFRLSKYQRSRLQSARALNTLSEQIPGFARKIADEKKRARNPATVDHEIILLSIPCKETQLAKECEKGIEILRLSRRALGEEGTLK